MFGVFLYLYTNEKQKQIQMKDRSIISYNVTEGSVTKAISNLSGEINGSRSVAFQIVSDATLNGTTGATFQLQQSIDGVKFHNLGAAVNITAINTSDFTTKVDFDGGFIQMVVTLGDSTIGVFAINVMYID